MLTADNPEMLTGSQRERGHNRELLEAEYNSVFLDNLSKHQHEVAKRALRRLFPRLDAIWSNTWHGRPSHWQRDRLICAEEHFRTYFAFGVTNDGITAAESDELVSKAGVEGATANALLAFLAQPRRRGGTRASLALQELNVRAGDIVDASVGQFLVDVFAIADQLDIKADEKRGFDIGSNQLRLHWLLNSLLLDRFDLPTRTEYVRRAAEGASLIWLVR